MKFDDVLFIAWAVYCFMNFISGILREPFSTQELAEEPLRPALPARPRPLVVVPDPRIRFLPERTEVPAAHCPVCAVEASTDAVHCPRCGVPHHLECLEYNGRCGIYGCSYRVAA